MSITNEMNTSQVSFRLKKDLKLRKRPIASAITRYAEQLGAKTNFNHNGTIYYTFTENQYKQLIEIYEK